MEHPSAALDSEIAGAIDALAGELERAGATVTRRSDRLPSLADSQALVDRFRAVAEAMAAPPDTPASVSVKDYVDCLMAQESVRRQWDAFFRGFDVLIAPCYATAAFTHFEQQDPWPGLNRTLSIDGREVAYAPQHAWPLIAGMPRLPATVVPIGTTRDGLPIAMQVIGPFLEDRSTIGFAAQASAAFGLTAPVARPAGGGAG